MLNSVGGAIGVHLQTCQVFQAHVQELRILEQRDPHLSQVESEKRDSSDVPTKGDYRFFSMPWAKTAVSSTHVSSTDVYYPSFCSMIPKVYEVWRHKGSQSRQTVFSEEPIAVGTKTEGVGCRHNQKLLGCEGDPPKGFKVARNFFVIREIGYVEMRGQRWQIGARLLGSGKSYDWRPACLSSGANATGHRDQRSGRSANCNLDLIFFLSERLTEQRKINTGVPGNWRSARQVCADTKDVKYRLDRYHNNDVHFLLVVVGASLNLSYIICVVVDNCEHIDVILNMANLPCDSLTLMDDVECPLQRIWNILRAL
ncbi:hypothetical protein TNCV_361631 [Trichonephila clavipes]|nr:hypothetical protein TNCV_361631 [Trichonephila clavipes]